MQPKLIVTMVSESAFTIQGHGVHTAFVELTKALAARQDIVLRVNALFARADITHIHTFGPYGLLQLLFGAGKKVVSVHVVPDSLVGSIAGAHRFYRLAAWYMRLFYSRADLLLPVSQTVKQLLINQLGVTKPATVFYNAIDMQAYTTLEQAKTAARQALAVALDKKVVVSCGQIQPRKRFDTFCAVAKDLPDMQFIWVGGIPFKHAGAEHAHMQRLIDERPANVLVTGVVQHSEVKRYLQAGDVFFLPSDQENHPMAVLEAAGVGLPIIVRDLSEYDDTFAQDVFRGNEATFTHLIQQLCSDRQVYAQGQTGAKAIAQRFDIHAAAGQLVALYKGLLEPGREVKL